MAICGCPGLLRMVGGSSPAITLFEVSTESSGLIVTPKRRYGLSICRSLRPPSRYCRRYEFPPTPDAARNIVEVAPVAPRAVCPRRSQPQVATTFLRMPPAGKTKPRGLISPVMAPGGETGLSVIGDISAINIATPTDGRSLGRPGCLCMQPWTNKFTSVPKVDVRGCMPNGPGKLSFITAAARTRAHRPRPRARALMGRPN